MCPSTLAESVGITQKPRTWEVSAVNWTSQFHPERRADWSDIAAEIRGAVTMEDVLHAYAPSVHTRNHRCPCPIHNGKDLNFSYTSNGYKCFVCGASGDVISFTQTMCQLSDRKDAMCRINSDFRLNLPINGTISAIQSADLALKRAERERREAEHTAWVDEYNRLWDEWTKLDISKRTADPMTAEYADAVKRIDYVGYLIDNLRQEQR